MIASVKNSLFLVLEDKGSFFSVPFFERYHVRAVVTTRAYNMAFEEAGPPISPPDVADWRDLAFQSHHRKRRIGEAGSCQGDGHRRQAYQELGLNWRNLVCPSQTHGDTVRQVMAQEAGQGVYQRSSAFSETDALITDELRLPIAVLTADCLSILLFDPHRKAIGVVHAGWQGVKNAVILSTIARMREIFRTRACDLRVVLGPCIRSCCYEVKDEFSGYFKTSVIQRDKRFYFDLAGELIQQVLSAGVSERHILDSRICTSCMNSRFFSYRREGLRAGRSMTAIEIQG